MAVEADGAAVGREQPGDGGDGGGLAGAVEPEQDGGLALLHLERDAVQDREAVADRERVDFEERHQATASGSSPRYARTTSGCRRTSSGRPSASTSPKLRQYM